jgi:hypothetical protein
MVRPLKTAGSSREGLIDLFVLQASAPNSKRDAAAQPYPEPLSKRAPAWKSRERFGSSYFQAYQLAKFAAVGA